MNILGLSAFFHDSAAALVQEGVVQAAAEEERFTRTKHETRFPISAARFCLADAGLTIRDVDLVVLSLDPSKYLDRLMTGNIANTPENLSRKLRNFYARNVRLREHVDFALGTRENRLPIKTVSHHLAHAASAYYPSPFDEAAIIVADGVGEWATTSYGIGFRESLNILKEIKYPHSLGLLYTMFTTLCGFRANSDEYKLMGLAAFGVPRFQQEIVSKVFRCHPDGSVEFHSEFLRQVSARRSWTAALASTLNVSVRLPSVNVGEIHADLAASVQQVIEESLFSLFKTVVAQTGQRNVAYAGGLAFNVQANSRLLEYGIVDELWIQPAAGDAGTAVGGALAGHFALKGRRANVSKSDRQSGSRLGPHFSEAYINALVKACNAQFIKFQDRRELSRYVAHRLDAGEILGVFCGRMEFGPRALGGRSIVASPMSAKARENLNSSVKKREAFRPFGAVVLPDYAEEIFSFWFNNEYMLFTARLRAKPIGGHSAWRLDGSSNCYTSLSPVPAVTHADWSCRTQILTRKEDILFQILDEFRNLTGVGALLNTSFNKAEEPIVCTPEEAIQSARDMNLDGIVFDDIYVHGLQSLRLHTNDSEASLPALSVDTFDSRLAALVSALTPFEPSNQTGWMTVANGNVDQAIEELPDLRSIIQRNFEGDAIAKLVSDHLNAFFEFDLAPRLPAAGYYALD